MNGTETDRPHTESHLADVVEVAVRGLLHSRHFVQLVEQLVSVELGRQERQSLETERFPTTASRQRKWKTAVGIRDRWA